MSVRLVEIEDLLRIIEALELELEQHRRPVLMLRGVSRRRAVARFVAFASVEILSVAYLINKTRPGSLFDFFAFFIVYRVARAASVRAGEYVRLAGRWWKRG